MGLPCAEDGLGCQGGQPAGGGGSRQSPTRAGMQGAGVGRACFQAPSRHVILLNGQGAFPLASPCPLIPD